MRLCLRREVVNLRSRVLGRLVEMDAHGGLRWNVTVLVVGAGFIVAVVVEDRLSVHGYGSVYVVAVGRRAVGVKAALIALSGYCDVSESVVVGIVEVEAVVLVGVGCYVGD